MPCRWHAVCGEEAVKIFWRLSSAVDTFVEGSNEPRKDVNRRITGNQINDLLESIYPIILFVFKVVIRLCLLFVYKAFLSLSLTLFEQISCKSCVNSFVHLFLPFLCSCCYEIDPRRHSFPVKHNFNVRVEKRGIEDRTGSATIHY